jgi:hypothetical protein
VVLDGLDVERAMLLPGGTDLPLSPDGSLDLSGVEPDPAVTLVRLDAQAARS